MLNRITIPRDLLECLVDEDECDYDHHGGCQTHGFLSLKPGEKCPHAEAKEYLLKSLSREHAAKMRAAKKLDEAKSKTPSL